MRQVSVIFVNVTGLSIQVTADQPQEVVQRRAHRMMLEVQRSMYNSEGSINKLLVDDKVSKPAAWTLVLPHVSPCAPCRDCWYYVPWASPP